MALKTRMKVLDGNTDNIWLDTALKVAFTSTDMKSVNQHFGHSKTMAIYAVDAERSKLLEVFEFGEAGLSDDDDKLSSKLEVLDGCVAVYTQAAGASAAGQLKAMGVFPVKVSAGASIQDLLDSLQEELRLGPSAWLANAIKSNMLLDPSRFDEMENQGWDE